MVALLILAVLSGMAFRGVDAIVRAKDRALADTAHTLKLNTGMSQFEYDVSQMINTQVVDPFSYDGATLRLTRRTPAGMQLVLWTLQAHRWQRWASPPMTKVLDLQEAWLRSQQWDSIAGNAVTVIDKVDTFQVYAYCGGWGNVQSTCNANTNTNANSAPPPPPPPPSVPSAPTGGGNHSSGQFPTGIRIQLGMSEGTLVRDKELPAL